MLVRITLYYDKNMNCLTIKKCIFCIKLDVGTVLIMPVDFCWLCHACSRLSDHYIEDEFLTVAQVMQSSY